MAVHCAYRMYTRRYQVSCNSGECHEPYANFLQCSTLYLVIWSHILYTIYAKDPQTSLVLIAQTTTQTSVLCAISFTAVFLTNHKCAFMPHESAHCYHGCFCNCWRRSWLQCSSVNVWIACRYVPAVSAVKSHQCLSHKCLWSNDCLLLLNMGHFYVLSHKHSSTILLLLLLVFCNCQLRAL